MLSGDCNEVSDINSTIIMNNIALKNQLISLIIACDALTNHDKTAASAFLYMVDTSTIRASLDFADGQAILSFVAKTVD